MIRILQVITSMDIGGAEKLVTDMSPLMLKEGLKVDVLLFDGTDTPFKQRLQKEGVTVFSLSEGGNVYNPYNIYKLLAYLPKYDIIHTHNTACQLYVALAACVISESRRPQLITTEHNTTNRRRNIKFLKSLDKWMYNQYQRIVAISEKAHENLVKYMNFDEKRVDIIFNGINLDVFRSVECLPQKSIKNQINVIMVAGFREQKDQKTLIKAMEFLPSNYHLSLVGDGECRNECELLTKEFKLQSRIHFLGKREDVPALLKASDVIVMSSYYEGLSLSSIEGMASGRPFIASDVDGLHEITEGAGVLFPCGNSEKLAEEIQELIEDSEYYKNVASACVRRAAEFDICSTVKNYIQIYKEILHV